ncbi:MAG TPA: NUDIX domain-containing protein, partial [Stellaceae bacterium]|nr:NUDIX domain-containing protein [Stellaceae bacterium]
MIADRPPPVAPRPAATLLLLRDGAAGLEVLMTARHEEAGFAAGALVFPGGKVDPVDAALAAHCPASGLDPAALVLRVAAIRETFEECGILLARADGALVSAELLAALMQRHGRCSDSVFASLVAA